MVARGTNGNYIASLPSDLFQSVLLPLATDGHVRPNMPTQVPTAAAGALAAAAAAQ